MRKFIVLAFFSLFFIKNNAQDIRNSFALYSDPVATYKDGFNVGLIYEYQREHSFNKLEIFVFPDLRGMNYTELSFSHGINWHIGRDYKYRLYANIKGGVVKRSVSKSLYPVIGFQSGYQYYFNGLRNGLYVGGRIGYDNRTDGKSYDPSLSSFWRENGYLEIGFTF